ncbi:hypothetical protein BDZ85DRAFT_262426 [Elsinoe ampelina]|uniref:Secreted protein n=1 Tax=Elsinoe ampelina TaxID=302913 RepID=A0A6A6GAY8_9PEZI|nr:hypothetical protein BDZ85DRAFT_262426 [Elsinoe ampelina]
MWREKGRGVVGGLVLPPLVVAPVAPPLPLRVLSPPDCDTGGWAVVFPESEGAAKEARGAGAVMLQRANCWASERGGAGGDERRRALRRSPTC